MVAIRSTSPLSTRCSTLGSKVSGLSRLLSFPKADRTALGCSLPDRLPARLWLPARQLELAIHCHPGRSVCRLFDVRHAWNPFEEVLVTCKLMSTHFPGTLPGTAASGAANTMKLMANWRRRSGWCQPFLLRCATQSVSGLVCANRLDC